MEQSEPPTRELTLEEAVSIAIVLQKNEQLVEAQELYRRVLKTAPNHRRALHYSGVLAHQQGRTHEAVMLIEKSLELQPDQADCYNNPGIILQSGGKLERAMRTSRRSQSIRTTRMLTAILACCCERSENHRKQKQRIAGPFN
jgi:Flp pilus assembly protein TadD